MIIAKNIHKSFGDLHVLKGIDLEIYKSEVVSIVGKSGSGKTTLLQILGTLDQAENGNVFIDNENISSKTAKEISKLRNEKIGFVFQFHHLLAEFSALENVCIPAQIKNTQKSIYQNKAKELLHYLGLSDRLNHKPSQLSGGEQQRVALARALINQPQVIFADEPTGNLDGATSFEIQELLFRIRKDFGSTVVIVTHNEELAKSSDRIFRLFDGNLASSDE